MKKLLFLTILVISRLAGLAQDDENRGRFRFFSLKFHSGRHYYTGTALKDKLKNGYTSVETSVGWQSKGNKDWQKEHNYPSYGIGL